MELFEGRMDQEHASSASSPGVQWLHPAGTSDYPKGVSVVTVVDQFKMEGLLTLEQVCLEISLTVCTNRLGETIRTFGSWFW